MSLIALVYPESPVPLEKRLFNHIYMRNYMQLGSWDLTSEF